MEFKLLNKNDENRRLTFLGFLVLIFGLFFVPSITAQTQLIPVSDGAFETGNSFEANGWTTANDGSGAVKWVVGTAVNSGAITGNSAYVSLDGGETNSYAGISGARTVFFYRDIALPAGQTNIALTFDWKSVGTSGTSWQVFAAPTSYTPIGTDLQTNVPATIAGLTSITYGSINGVTSKAIGFIPASFAGTTVRLIFMWTNSNGGGTNPPAAIDNISLVSRAGGSEIASVATGNFSDPNTWDVGYVPSPADDVVINGGHTVTIDNKNLGAGNLYIAGANAVVDFGALADEFTVTNDLLISGSGARLNVYQGTTGKSLKVGHDITVVSGGRLDISVGSTSANAGVLTLNGSELQTISSDGTGIIGGTVSSTTTTNAVGVINQLIVNNTSTATPNIDWQLDDVRIKNILRLNSARVALGSNNIYIGNYGSIFSSNFVCASGSGFIGGQVSRWYTTSAMGSPAIDPGIDYNPNTTVLYPFLSNSGQNRWAFLISPSATAAGYLSISYDDATTFTTGLSVADDSYTISDRYDGNWTVSKDATYATTGNFTFGVYAVGAYNALDGSSRVMNAGSVVGAHTNGTTTPFASRKNIPATDLFAAPFYVGFNAASAQGSSTKTSVASGDWNDAATWSPNGVPSCSDVVTVAHTVTVNSAGNNAAGVIIKAGATLVNTSGDLTVGCTNNNAVFANYGTNTVSGGILTVNGAVYHKVGSSFNHTNGDIVVDSNNAGDAATSVGQGGSSFKLDTSNLNLTGGKITIVDPLINNTEATTAVSGDNFTLTSLPTTFEESVNAFAAGTTSLSVPGFFTNVNLFAVGQHISGPGIQPGTTITAVSALINISLTLSLPTTEAQAGSTTLTFSAMANGQKNIVFPTDGNFGSVAIGQTISGPGIPAGTTVVSAGAGFSGTGGITLSNPVSGLTTSPIAAAQTVTLSAMSEGSNVILLAAENPAIIVGQAVAGEGIPAGTTITAVTGNKITMSSSVSGAFTSPVALTFYDGNLNSFAFAYNSTANYAAGLNHTLQIGDGVSTDKADVTITGFYTNLAQGGGTLSLGNLIVDAPDGTNRFFNAVNGLYIQNATTVTAGSVFKKTNTTNGIAFGGNITNDGSIFVGLGSVYFGSGYNTTTFSVMPTNLPQTISGTGSFYNNLDAAVANGSLSSWTVYNTNPAGVTIAIPDFRVTSTITMTAGIIHTSSATPLYHGPNDTSSQGSILGNPSETCYIDGTYVRTFGATQTSSFYYVCPVGTPTAYRPISLAVSGGGIFKIEAFDTNAGTTSANVANLSATRWKAERVGTAGNLLDFNVRLGDASITADHIIVQATTDEGIYDNVFGNNMVFTAGTPNTINTDSAIPGTEYEGFFAYATEPNCITVNPGSTIADLTITQLVTTQNSSATGIASGLATVTLQTANTNIAEGLTVTGTGIPAGTTVVSVSGTTLTLSQEATLSSSSQTALSFWNIQNPTTVCGTQSVALSLENESAGSGVTYQWQESTDGGNNYTDISAANGATYVAYPTANTYYRCEVTCPFGSVTVNSTPVEVTFSNALTSVIGDSICGEGEVALTAAADSGTINWYADETGGVALATGETYSPTVTETTTYYVSTETTSNYLAGKTFAGTTAQTAPFSGLVFNTSTNIRLNSVKVYPKQTTGAADANAPITIKLFKDGVQVAGTEAVTFIPEVNTGQYSTAISNTVVLNYDIPAGNGYRLLATHGLSSTNSIGKLSSYPAQTPAVTGAISFTGSVNSFDGTPDASYNNFFDWDVTEICASPRVAVTATVTPITTNTTTTSACGTYTWSENDETYTETGIYTVVSGCHTETLDLTINEIPVDPSGDAIQTITVDDLNDATLEDIVITPANVVWYATSDDALAQTNPLDADMVLTNDSTYFAVNATSECVSAPFAVTVTVALSTNGFDDRSFTFYPNPTSGILNISYSNEITRVQVINLVGQMVQNVETNQNDLQIDLSSLPASTYFVKVESNGSSKTIKVVKQN